MQYSLCVLCTCAIVKNVK